MSGLPLLSQDNINHQQDTSLICSVTGVSALLALNCFHETDIHVLRDFRESRDLKKDFTER